MLEIRDLRHEYAGRTVLHVREWSVPKGEASLVIGPSGSGKSTLLGIIAGLVSATGGKVSVDAREVTSLGALERDAFRARHIGLVLQTLHLIGVVSVRDNLRIAQRLAGLARDDGAIDERLESLGIAASVLVLGAAVALTLRPTLAVSLPLIGLFAALHGYSHGVELPANASALSYAAGFIAATLVLHLIGIALGFAANRMPVRFAARTAGGAIAALGLVLLVVPH
jgi:ABC-type Fe3+/spermidine/putrescine transport system ATPase subunit